MTARTFLTIAGIACALSALPFTLNTTNFMVQSSQALADGDNERGNRDGQYRENGNRGNWNQNGNWGGNRGGCAGNRNCENNGQNQYRNQNQNRDRNRFGNTGGRDDDD